MLEIEKFKYCFHCKALFQIKGENLLVCPKCDLHYYINPKPVNAVLLFNENRELLLVRRAFDPFKGMWDVPGGFVEINETLEESVYRELKEELGIVPKKLSYHHSSTDTYLYKGTMYYTLGFVFTGEISSSMSIKVQDDVTEYKFIKVGEVPLEEIGFSAVREAIGELD